MSNYYSNRSTSNTNRQNLDTGRSKSDHSKRVEMRIMERSSFTNPDFLSQNHSFTNPASNFDSTDFNNAHGFDNHNFRNSKNNLDEPKSNKKRFGEITGQMFDSSELEKGMPIRTFVAEPKKNNFSDKNFRNNYLDFELYEDDDVNTNEKNQNKNDIDYYDPNAPYKNHTMFSDVAFENENPRLQKQEKESLFLNQNINPLQKNPLVEFSLINNDYSWFLHAELDTLMKGSKYVISAFSSLIPFIILYRGSKSFTESEIKTFFSLNNKDDVFFGATELNNLIIKNMYLTISNVIFFRDDLEINPQFKKYVENTSLCFLDNINSNMYLKETSRLNNMFKKLSRNSNIDIISDGVINPETLIMPVNAFSLRTVWKSQFNPTLTSSRQFFNISLNNASTVSNQLMMSSHNQKIHYYEDNLNQLVELEFINGDFSMGFILPKSRIRPDVDLKMMNSYISSMKITEMSVVSIPKFTQKNKYKLGSAFKRLGLQDIFSHTNLNDIVLGNKDTNITDIIHQTILVVDEGANNSSYNDSITYFKSSNVSFIANHTFAYYVRCKQSNAIVLTGVF
jgi:serine protease inhibitor